MKHIYKQATNPSKPTFLVLHGTGGTENDLIPLAFRNDPEAGILSVRGNVLEGGMSRYFRRLSEGVFDEADLVFRTNELNQFLDESAIDYGFDRNNIIAIGYSNGANIAASLLFHHKDALRGAILHHPMVPRRGIDLPNLMNKYVLVTAGTNDSMCPKEESIELVNILNGAHAHTDIFWDNKGHQLTADEVEAAAMWYRKTL